MDFPFKFKTFFLAALLLSVIASGCSDDDPDPIINNVPPSRGRVLGLDLVSSWDSLRIDSLINSIDPFLTIFFRKDYDVDFYKVNYATVSYDGSMTTASGGLAVPRARRNESVERAPLVGYSHGTVLHKEGVPSRGGGETAIGLLLATDGYLVAMPDFLGLGDSPGFHPYTHAKSEATAVVDMLRASREVAQVEKVDLNGKVFLVGYSQGGHATLATTREIETYHASEFNLKGSAPMSGPYDVSGVQEQYLLAFTPYPTPGYLPYILYSYNTVYDIIPDPVTILKPPYDSIVPPNMNQITTMGQLNQLCNPVPRRMILDSVMNAYENDPVHPLKVALRDNDLYLGWVPQSPVRMFYCKGDDQVSYENAIVAYNEFQNAGAPFVSVVRMDDDANLSDHNECAPNSLLLGKVWFDSLNAQ